MNFSRILEIARLELRFNLRRPLFWFFLITLALFAFGLSTGSVQVNSGDSSVGGKKAFLTSMFANARLVSLVDFMLFGLFLAAVAGMPILRDEEARITDLLKSTPLREREFVFGKFLGIFGVYVMAMLAQVALTILFNHALSGANVSEYIGPLQLSNYLVPQLAFVLPMSLFFAGTTFAVGTLTRRPALVFSLPLVIIVAAAFFVFENATEDQAGWLKAILMYSDPSGWRWINETWMRVDRGTEFYNTQPIGFDFAFLLSRGGLAGVGILAVGLTAWARSRKTQAQVGIARGHAPMSEPTSPFGQRLALPPMSIRPLPFFTALREMFGFEAKAMLAHPALWLFVPLIALQVVGETGGQRAFLETTLLVTSGSAAATPLGTLVVLVCALLLFFMVEALHREESHRLEGVVHSTPISTPVLLIGKVLASSVIAIAVLLASFIGYFILIKTQDTAVPFQSWPFILLWGIVLLPTYLLWSAFVAAIYGISRNRLAVYGIALGVLALMYYENYIGKHMSWVFNWNLAGGPLYWTDIGTLEFNAYAITLNRILVLLATVFFAALAIRLFPRREPDAAIVANTLKPGALARHAWQYAWILAPILALGGYLHFLVESGFQGDAAKKQTKDYWRRNNATFLDYPQPEIAHVDIDLDLYPDEHRLVSKGFIDLVSREDKPFTKLLLTGDLHWREVKWTLDGVEFTPENRDGLYVFDLKTPLVRDAHAKVGFEFHGNYPNGITKNGGGDGQFVMPSSVVLTAFGPAYMPMVGYLPTVGIDEDNRTNAKEYPDDYHVGMTKAALGIASPFTVRTTLRGPDGFRLNGVGTLVSETEKDGRRTYVWETDHPVHFFNVVGGRLLERKGEGTALWYHPGHEYNLDSMMEALDGARKYFSEWFYPYPWEELKVTEFAGHDSYAQGFATNISFSENIGFTVEEKPGSHLAFMVTAHESAHQWWGNLLFPADGPGANILSEGMAHFSTILLTGQVKGEYARQEFCRRLERKYNDDRFADAERPMIRVDGTHDGDTTVQYDKGGMVFWMMLNLIGRESMLKGCHDFIDKYLLSRDAPALQDFVEHMRNYAPNRADYDVFAKQWFFEVAVPHLKFVETKKVPPADGPWMVTGNLENRGTGRVRVEVAAIRGTQFDEDGKPNPDYREARKLVEVGPDAPAAFSIPCDFDPEKVIVDPEVKLLMLKRSEAEAKL